MPDFSTAEKQKKEQAFYEKAKNLEDKGKVVTITTKAVYEQETKTDWNNPQIARRICEGIRNIV